jgi:uncharacterized protein
MAASVVFSRCAFAAVYWKQVADEAGFDWDEANVRHIARHGIVTDEVLQVFANGPIDIDFDVIGGEERWTSAGHTDTLRVLVVVWTMRGEFIRPLTAFAAGQRLRREYLKRLY